ncbi:MAG: class I SAM-dependent methyltransferase [Patescibacteria group bacterium]
MQPSCHICGIGSVFLLTKDGYALYRCSNCLLVFVSPTPTEDFLSQEVYSEESGYQAHKKSDFSELVQDGKTRKIFEELGQRQGRTLLDVGCSSGEFLYWAQKAGFDVSGVELNPRTATIAKQNGLAVTVGTIESLPISAGTFDIIFLGDVIEHVPNPRKLIADCKRLLNPSGILIISTPNLDCLWGRITLSLYRWFRIPPSTLTPPFHLFQFSKGNLDQLLSRSGFFHTKAFFLSPPKLVYELGMLHLRKRFKQRKSAVNLGYMIFAYCLYTVAYGLNKVLQPLLTSNFAMVVFYQKKHA